jgi:hypothetical protein
LRFAGGADGAEERVFRPIWNGFDDPSYRPSEPSARTQEVVGRASLGPGVIFDGVLLVLERYCDVLGNLVEARVSEREKSQVLVPEPKVAESDRFRSAGFRRYAVFTRPHGEKVGPDDQVDCVIVDVGADLLRGAELVQGA